MGGNWKAGDVAICIAKAPVWTNSWAGGEPGPRSGQLLHIAEVKVFGPNSCPRCGSQFLIFDEFPARGIFIGAYDSCHFRKLDPYEATEDDNEVIRIMRGEIMPRRRDRTRRAVRIDEVKEMIFGFGVLLAVALQVPFWVAIAS